MANYNPYSTNSYQATQMFPQPQGNVYILNNSMELGTMPMCGGISVGICPNENLMYMKAMVNGAPSLMSYTIAPCGMKLTKCSNTGMMKLNERSKDIPNYKRGEFLTLLFFHSQLKISTFGEQVSLIYFPIPTASASSSVKLTSNQSFAS